MSAIRPPSPTTSSSPYNSDSDSRSSIRHVGRTVMAEVPVSLQNTPKKKKQQSPQQAVDEFWAKFTTKFPGKATTIIPHNQYAKKAAEHCRTTATGITTQASYDEAAAVCRAKVRKIVKECRRVNQKYRDPHFDLEFDLKWGKRDTLESLWNVRGPRSPSSFRPKSVKRVVDVFENPKFYIDGPTANDVRQGRDGDCWLLAALCTLSNKPSLIERVCVAQDQMVGVYGFVFHRDGEWISEIIDDKLFLTKPDFDESFLERMLWEDRERVNSEEQYRKAYQSGSGALYFAQCEHADETWLPLLEKAYAKAHGDYAAIEGGFTGEGIEDLTGGVTSELYTTDILDKEYFWKEELMKVNDEFLFGCSTGMWGIGWGERKGIVELHAYSIMRAVEIDGQRLLLLKNPWGKGEWKGPWSDGSKEWTAEWLKKLNHRFGDDGAFWISYEDLLRKYQAFDRTRLFGNDWKVMSLWTTVSVPWTLDYHETQFAFSLSRTGPVVIVLSQLDDRYYRGLEGQYRFELNFRIHKAGQEDYVVRSISPYCQKRSVNVELELDAGDYTILMKINATRHLSLLPIEEVVRNYARDRRDKLVAVGMSYDLAHSKGQTVETEEERKARKEYEKRKRDRAKKDFKKKLMDGKKRDHYMAVKDLQDRRKARAKVKAKNQARKERKEEKQKKRAEERMKVEAQVVAEEDRMKLEAQAKAEEERRVEEAEKASEAEKPSEAAEEKARVELSQLAASSSGGQEAGPIPERPKEKHVQIQTPRPSVDPEDSRVLPSKDSDSATEASIKTPPTESSQLSPVMSPMDGQQEPEAATERATTANSRSGTEGNAPQSAEGPAEGLAEGTAEGTAEAQSTPADRATTAGTQEPQHCPCCHDHVRAMGPGCSPGPGRPPSPRYPPSPRHPPGPGNRPGPRRPPSPGYPPSPRHPPGPGNRPGPRRLPVPRYHPGPWYQQGPGPPRIASVASMSDTETSSESDIPSISDISDQELEYLFERTPSAASPPPPIPAPRQPAEEEDEFERNPWNAVATVGLRVYYKVLEEDKDQEVVQLRVVRPNPYGKGDEDQGGEKGEAKEANAAEKASRSDQEEEDTGEEGKMEKGLDVDDASKDATLVGDGERRKKSIVPANDKTA